MANLKNIWVKLGTFSPALVRLMAADRKRGTAWDLDDDEIAKRAGMTVSKVQSIYWNKTWNNISVGDMKRFVKACNVDFGNPEQMKIHSNFLRNRTKLVHIRRSKHHKLYESLIRFLGEPKKGKTNE